MNVRARRTSSAPMWGLGMLVTALLLPNGALAASFFVDPSLSGDCASAYDPATRACAGGTGRAYRSLSAALGAAAPDDTVWLRQGTYGKLSTPKSGTNGHPINVRRYGTEQVTITGVGDPALWIIGSTDWVFEGFTVDNVGGWGRLEDASRIVLRDLILTRATISGTTGGLKLVRSTFNRIERCRLEDGNDNLVLQDDSDHNVIRDTSFVKGRHSLVSVRCSSFNVFRGNTFSNATQKAVEIYDCEGTSDAPVRLDDTKQNLFERNEFALTLASTRDYDYNAMQHGAQYTIVRRNVFHDCQGGGVNYQHYSDESLHVYGNRLYNNTFYNNRCYAIVGSSGPSTEYYDNRVVNNLLYQNASCSGGAQQTSISNATAVVLKDNLLAATDPGFVNAAGSDFRLVSTSAAIDKGGFVTTTASAGSGTSLIVGDVRFFYDGYGIPEEAGDWIRLAGQVAAAQIVKIDAASRTLALSRALSWSSGAGVHLAYLGDAPDVGAFEHGCGDGTCAGSEDCASCPEDCGGCQSRDGGGVLDGGSGSGADSGLQADGGTGSDGSIDSATPRGCGCSSSAMATGALLTALGLLGCARRRAPAGDARR